MSVKIYLNSDNGLVIEEANGVIYNRTQGDLSAKSENGRIEFCYSASGASFKDYAILDVVNALGVAYGSYAAIISAISDFFVDAALAAAEQLEVDLGIEVQNRTSEDINLQNQINTVASGYLGAIAYNASAPTPAKNGWYDFSTGGVVSWLTGTPNVKIGDRVSVLYTAPAYVYTYQNIDINGVLSKLDITSTLSFTSGSVYLKNGTTASYDGWFSSQLLSTVGVNNISGTIHGYGNICAVSFFTSLGVFISGWSPNDATGATGDISRFTFNKSIPANAAFYRIANNVIAADHPTITLSVTSTYFLNNLQNTAVLKEFPNLTLKIPSKVYTVANNIGEASERNFSSVLYLDNFFNGVTKEYNMRFGNGSTKLIIPFKSTTYQTGYEKPSFNNGANVSETVVPYTITGNQSIAQSLSVLNRCVLNSATSGKNIHVWFVGDSITYGQNALFPNSIERASFPCLLNELFKKDNIQNGGVGYGFRTIGTNSWNRTFTYMGASYTVKTFHEGYQGWTLQGLMSSAKFIDGSNNFSPATYISKYRTCDESGNRLYFNASMLTTGVAGSSNHGYLADGTDSGLLIGSLITNTNAFDVYTPTHIFEFMGTNSALTSANLTTFINACKSAFPNVIIGIGQPHFAGTYFPSLYPNIPKSAVWDNGESGNQIASQALLSSIFDNSTYEAQKVFVLPTYFVNPAALSCGTYKSNEPYSEFIEAGGDIGIPKGQNMYQHVGGHAHAAYAYQIYSWIKWTIANNLF